MIITLEIFKGNFTAALQNAQQIARHAELHGYIRVLLPSPEERLEALDYVRLKLDDGCWRVQDGAVLIYKDKAEAPPLAA